MWELKVEEVGLGERAGNSHDHLLAYVSEGGATMKEQNEEIDKLT